MIAVATNRPFLVTVPQYGPDAYSYDMNRATAARANSISPASNGMGIIRYLTSSDAYFAARQNFRGFTSAVREAEVKLLAKSGQLPAASAQVDPILLAFSANQIARL